MGPDPVTMFVLGMLCAWWLTWAIEAARRRWFARPAALSTAPAPHLPPPPKVLANVERIALMQRLANVDGLFFAVLSGGKQPWREWRQ